MGSFLPLPVGEPVEQRVQHGDPSIAYHGHVVASGSRGLLGHSVDEGEVTQIADYMGRPAAVKTNVGVLSISF